MPKVKFKVNKGNQVNLTKNWKKPTDLLKPPHNIKEPINEKHVEFKAINFNSLVSREGIKNKIPIIGNNKM